MKFPIQVSTIALLSATLPNFADEPNLFEMSLEDLMQVTITIANKSEQTTSTAPSPVTVYTREEIRHMGINSLDELLNFVPGVQTGRAQEDLLSSAPIFRGQSNQHGSTPSVLLMIDGRRINGHVFGGAFEAPLNNLDWVKQVEVIRGPGSTLYGANAFLGVINIITEIKPAEFNVSVGQLGMIDASLQLSNQYNTAEVELYLHRYQDDGQFYPAFYEFLGTFDDTTDPFNRSTLALNISIENWHFNSYLSQAVAENFVLGSTLGNGINKQDTTITNFRVSYDGFKNTKWNLNLYVDYLNNDADYFVRFLPAALASFAFWTDGSMVDAKGGNHLEQEYQQIGLEGQLKLNEQHSLTFGLEHRYEWVDVNPFHGNWDFELMSSSSGTTIIPCDCVSRGFWLGGERYDFLKESTRYVSNIWIQDQWRINDELVATIGARYDHYDDFGGQTSLRSALVYQYSNSSSFKLLYGEAFRAPSFLDTRGAPASNFVSNPDLKPETIKTIDMVWIQSFNNSNLVLSWSKSELEDEVIQVATDIVMQQGVIAFQPQNMGNSDLSNWEIEFNSNLTDNLLLKTGLTHHIEQDEFGTSRNLLFMVINYQKEQWNINFNGYYHDKVLARKQGGSLMHDLYIDSFWHFNLAINYQWNEQMNLYLHADNLFDAKYSNYSSTVDLETGLPARERLISFGLSWQF